MKALLAVLLICMFVTVDAKTIISYRPPSADEDVRDQYFIDLLTLILERTRDEFGDYELTFSRDIIVQSRAAALIAANDRINILWSMTSPKNEQMLRPIRIPLQKGLLGLRIFIVRKPDSQKFANIENIYQLKRFKAGQGHDWPDTEILRTSGLPVVTSPSYQSLFKMLSERRFDYFPRGVVEPYEEVASHPDMNLTVEPSILLSYRAPIYFFVSKDNEELATRLETGLQAAIDDGSFDEFFYNHPQIKRFLEEANLTERKRFVIKNPLLTPETKKILDEPKYWYPYPESWPE
ncbi:MAG: transporter substrate-binding domain-containing protein [Reinekea sp.]|nr:transporter substrate-binding domain-containing protein [Reinekea sp.]